MSEAVSPPTGAKPATATPEAVTDSLGRVLTIKRMNALDELDLIEAVGGVNSENRRYMIMVTIASCVKAIDSVPCPPVATRDQIRGQVQRVGSEGIAAVMAMLTPDEPVPDAGDSTADVAKN